MTPALSQARVGPVAQPQRQPQPRRDRGCGLATISPAAVRQRLLRRPAALWGGGDTSGSGAAATPLAAALMSAVQLLAALQLAVPLPAAADGSDFTLRSQAVGEGAEEDTYFETVPQGLASADSSTAPRLGALIEGPKGKQVQQCTRKCVPTCIRGGQGAPGLGPMSLRWVRRFACLQRGCDGRADAELLSGAAGHARCPAESRWYARAASRPVQAGDCGV